MEGLAADPLFFMKAKEIFDYTLQQLTHPDQGEREAICSILLEDAFYLDRSAILLNDDHNIDVEQLNSQIKRLNNHEPVQQVVGFTYFNNLKFYVNQHVLIPRPETAEILKPIIENAQKNIVKIMDVGTGSGCIPVSLAKALPKATIYALDISKEALEVAKKNAALHHIKIHFIAADFLSFDPEKPLELDVLISNPPYIRELEKQEMDTNVLDFEPHLALFVPNENPLLFYKALAVFGQKHLKKGGQFWVEINSYLGQETLEVFKEHQYKELRLVKDIFDKDRFITGIC